MRGPNVDSDHFLQKVIILITHRKKPYNPKKCNKANPNKTYRVHSTAIQSVTGETDQTSGECSLGQTIPI